MPTCPSSCWSHSKAATSQLTVPPLLLLIVLPALQLWNSFDLWSSCLRRASSAEHNMDIMHNFMTVHSTNPCHSRNWCQLSLGMQPQQDHKITAAATSHQMKKKKNETTLQPQLSPPSISWQGAHWRWPLRMRRPVSSSTSTVQVQNSQLQFVRWNLFYAYLSAYLFITLCIFVEVTGCKQLLKEIKTILKASCTIWPPCAQWKPRHVWGQSTCRWSLQWQYSTVFAWQTEWEAPANSHGGVAEM